MLRFKRSKHEKNLDVILARQISTVAMEERHKSAEQRYQDIRAKKRAEIRKAAYVTCQIYC